MKSFIIYCGEKSLRTRFNGIICITYAICVYLLNILYSIMTTAVQTLCSDRVRVFTLMYLYTAVNV